MKHICVVAVFLVFAIISFAGCGRRGDYADEPQNDAPGSAARTLTITTPEWQAGWIESAGRTFTREMADYGIVVSLNIISYGFGEQEEHFSRILNQFYAGEGPDLFVQDFFPLYTFAELGFLADINELIDPASRDYFYTNVLDAFEINGRLYTFPMNFGFTYVEVNEELPHSLIEGLGATISPNDMLELYQKLIYSYPDFAHFSMIHGFAPGEFFVPELQNYIDFGNQIADLASFIPFLEQLRDSFDGDYRLYIPFHATQAPRENYMFARASFGEGNFLLTDNSGRAVLSAPTLKICVSATADAQLAWAFIEHLVRYTAQSEFSAWQNVRSIARETGDIIPVTVPVHMFYMPADAFVPDFIDFMQGNTNTIGVERRLNASLNEWLNAERIIEEFVPRDVIAEAQPEIDPNLPVRTLNILAADNIAVVLRQAAVTMNASLAALPEDERFRLELEIEYFDWLDLDNFDARLMRLQTQLMAGQGPDMFFLELDSRIRDEYNHPIRAFAASGFLRDINALIEQSPNTNRGDFFEHALDAFEINGGLYMFPASFGFNYVGINAKLPQQFIDRFAQYQNISIHQLMEIYMDIMAEYFLEFGHLQLGRGSLSNPRFVLNGNLASFVNFETRTANFTDPNFIAFLHNLRRVYEGYPDNFGFGWNYGGVVAHNILMDLRYNGMFHMTRGMFTAANALLTPITPYFLHYIPLVDEHGRMIIDLSSTFLRAQWGIFCITAAGDGELAWEFAQYIIPEFSQPTDPGNDPLWIIPHMMWGRSSLSTPIMRPLYERHMRTTLEYIFEYFQYTEARFGNQPPPQHFIGRDDPDLREREIQNVINRVAVYNEMPMTLSSSLIPQHLFLEPLDQFMRGLITAETTANQLQNRIGLWLIE